MTAMLISAAVLRASDAPYTIERAKLGDPGPGEVLVKIAGAGLCHTDLLGRTDLVAKPVVLGHEGAGGDAVVRPVEPRHARGHHRAQRRAG
jgi:aryl-alcohol dehydrogenase